MALFNDAYLSVGGTDLSAYLETVSVQESVETLDDTVMGDSTRSAEAGLNVRTLSAVFKHVNASGGPTQTLYDQVGNTLSVIYGAAGSTGSANNPVTTQTMLLESYEPVQGTVGDQQLVRAQFVSAGEASVAVS